MSPPTDLPTLLRFLTQDTKVPLATALSSVQALQKANLQSQTRGPPSNLHRTQNLEANSERSEEANRLLQEARRKQ
jgi:hypothetical protein